MSSSVTAPSRTCGVPFSFGCHGRNTNSSQPDNRPAVCRSDIGKRLRVSVYWKGKSGSPAVTKPTGSLFCGGHSDLFIYVWLLWNDRSPAGGGFSGCCSCGVFAFFDCRKGNSGENLKWRSVFTIIVGVCRRKPESVDIMHPVCFFGQMEQ